MKVGDKVYIITSNPHIIKSSFMDQYYTDTFNISEIKEIIDDYLILYPIIGNIDCVYYDKSSNLDRTLRINKYLFYQQYVTTNEKLAIEKYKQLLKEHGTV